MSVANYIASIESSRNTIRNKLVELGMAASNDRLDKLAIAIESIINQGAVSITVKEGDTITIPKGYHNGSGTIQGIAGGGGYTLQTKEVTPTKNQQNITPDSGYYGMSAVTVKAIPEVYQDVSSVTAGDGDVLTGKVFVAADGTVTPGKMINNGTVDKILDVTTITYTIPQGYHSGSGKVQITLETKTVTPTKTQQKIIPTSGKVLSQVVVEPIPEKYQDVTPVTAGAAQVLEGYRIVDTTGASVDGQLPNKGAIVETVGMSVNSYTIPAGYHNGLGTISLSNDIENALATI